MVIRFFIMMSVSTIALLTIGCGPVILTVSAVRTASELPQDSALAFEVPANSSQDWNRSHLLVGPAGVAAAPLAPLECSVETMVEGVQTLTCFDDARSRYIACVLAAVTIAPPAFVWGMAKGSLRAVGLATRGALHTVSGGTLSPSESISGIYASDTLCPVELQE